MAVVTKFFDRLIFDNCRPTYFVTFNSGFIYETYPRVNIKEEDKRVKTFYCDRLRDFVKIVFWSYHADSSRDEDIKNKNVAFQFAIYLSMNKKRELDENKKQILAEHLKNHFSKFDITITA
jgi:hypothetical protein